MRQLEKQLKNLINDPSMRVDDALRTRSFETILSRIDAEPVQLHKVADQINYFRFVASQAFLRPAAMVASIFVLVLGGWITTVNASFDSVPGDALYGVKLATERAQLTFAASDEKKMKLHVEFAKRRLTEVEQILSSDSKQKEELVKVAVGQFTNQMDEVNQQISNIKISNATQAAELAVIADEQSSAISKLLASANLENKEADEAVNNVNEQVVEVLVGETEKLPSELNTQNLSNKFSNDLLSIEIQQKALLGRLVVLQNVLPQYPEVEQKYIAELLRVRNEFLGLNDKSAEAMNLFAVGGYRKAFELIAQMRITIDSGRALVTEAELAITDAAVAQEQEQNIQEEEQKETTVEAETSI
ncbi:MAG: hypothetical protein ACD_76C00007G0001 [uncultured bacterium]|nr:MAG: hypothetical protein ACD_76C00007G0001 [uncultured bacterium]HBD05076.1 hypothetical protein [Candidatus Uhrbacteria bacterium]